jgi:hypothetical protein
MLDTESNDPRNFHYKGIERRCGPCNLHMYTYGEERPRSRWDSTDPEHKPTIPRGPCVVCGASDDVPKGQNRHSGFGPNRRCHPCHVWNVKHPGQERPRKYWDPDNPDYIYKNRQRKRTKAELEATRSDPDADASTKAKAQPRKRRKTEPKAPKSASVNVTTKFSTETRTEGNTEVDPEVKTHGC